MPQEPVSENANTIHSDRYDDAHDNVNHLNQEVEDADADATDSDTVLEDANPSVNQSIDIHARDLMDNDYGEDDVNQDMMAHEAADAVDATDSDDEHSNLQSNDSDSNSNSEHMPAQFTPVDISVLGKMYTINCPAGEEQNLLSATHDINTMIEDIRSQAPYLSHENLLILCCLNIYEQMQQQQRLLISKDDTISQAHEFVEQLLTATNNSE